MEITLSKIEAWDEVDLSNTMTFDEQLVRNKKFTAELIDSLHTKESCFGNKWMIGDTFMFAFTINTDGELKLVMFASSELEQFHALYTEAVNSNGEPINDRMAIYKLRVNAE